MTDNMREALRLQNEKKRNAVEQERAKQKKVVSTIGEALATIGTIALLLL
jgi:hypothetical protein